jgi:hypothetical protein
MSVLTTYEHKKKWFERAKVENLIQVNENHTRAKNKITWHERNHKGQINLSVPKHMGNDSTQPRQEHMISQEEAQRAQHQSCDDRKLNSTAGSSRRGKWAQHHWQKSKEHKTHKLPLNTCTRAKEHTKLTPSTCDRAKSTPRNNSGKQRKLTKAPPTHMHTYPENVYANSSSPPELSIPPDATNA